MVDVNLAHTLAQVLGFILGLVKLIVIASIIVSWIGDRSHPIVQAIDNISEPIYRPIRGLTSKIPGPLDWAPIGVFIVIMILEGLVVKPLAQYRGSAPSSMELHMGQ